MKVFLVDTKKHKAVVPFKGCDYVTVQGLACSDCEETPLRCHGKEGPNISADDQAYECHAFSVCCDKNVGMLRVETGTLFGVTEDEAVLNGRPRVY